MAINYSQLSDFTGTTTQQTLTVSGGTQGNTCTAVINQEQGDHEKFTVVGEAQKVFDENGNVSFTVSFIAPEATQEEQTFYAQLIVTPQGEEGQTIALAATVAAATTNTGGNEPTPNPDPEPETEEEEETEEEVNDFFSRKDVTGEVIRVFEEDYWPVDFVNVEPDKFAIMPGEGVELDCMFGDASIPAAETTTEPEGSGD